MSNWFFNEDPPPVDDEDIVDGWFECQTCGEIVGRAINDGDNGRLHWECPEGHQSEIEINI